MTAEEFRKSDSKYILMDKYSFAEAYAKHENEALQKQVDELKGIIESMKAFNIKQALRR